MPAFWRHRHDRCIGTSCTPSWRPSLRAAIPAQRITFVVAFAPGGIADTLARLIAHGVEGKLGQSVVVENRPGAGGNIAAGVVSRANPDGYTVLLTTTALAINLTLQKKNQFAAGDLKAVAITASSPEALVANPSNPAKNLAEFVKAAKDKSINFGSAGVGSGSHIEAEYFFKKIANINVVHIPYQGGAPAINALLGNQIDILATTLGGGAAAQIKGGKLKGLGIAADKRAAVVPDVPTYGEPGFPTFSAASWVGISRRPRPTRRSWPSSTPRCKTSSTSPRRRTSSSRSASTRSMARRRKPMPISARK